MVQAEARHKSANNNSSCNREERQADNRHQARSYELFKQTTRRQEADNIYTKHIGSRQRLQQAHNYHLQASQHHCQHHQQWTSQRIIGYEKRTCGNESTYIHAMSCTYHSRHNMDLTLQSSNLSELHSCIHKMEQG